MSDLPKSYLDTEQKVNEAVFAFKIGLSLFTTVY